MKLSSAPMPGKLKKRSLASHAVDDHDHGTASSDLSTQRDAALAAASELEQVRLLKVVELNDR